MKNEKEMDEGTSKFNEMKKKLNLEVLIVETVDKMKLDGYLEAEEHQKFMDFYFKSQKFSGTIHALFSIFDS